MKWAMSYAAGLSFKFTVQIDVNCIRAIQRDSMRNWQSITDSVYPEDTQFVLSIIYVSV